MPENLLKKVESVKVGLKGFQKRMYPEQYDRFMTSLCLYFGRNAYYKRRRGDFAMPPEEQEVALSALKKVGVTERLDFDSYEEAVFWGSIDLVFIVQMT